MTQASLQKKGRIPSLEAGELQRHKTKAATEGLPGKEHMWPPPDKLWNRGVLVQLVSSNLTARW